jgi:RNA polymerase sigma factor (sigma-70 family)
MAMVPQPSAAERRPPLELALFCEQQWPRLVGTLGFLVRDLRTAEDLAQETLARACQHWHKVSAMDFPGVWLHRVAVNLAHSHNRRRATRTRLAATLVERDAMLGDPATEIALRDAVRALPERERVAVTLRYFADLSVRDTAAVMRVNESTVKYLAQRAIEHLRTTALIDFEEVADA